MLNWEEEEFISMSTEEYCVSELSDTSKTPGEEPLCVLINKNKNTCHGLKLEIIEPLTHPEISRLIISVPYLVAAITSLAAGLRLACCTLPFYTNGNTSRRERGVTKTSDVALLFFSRYNFV